MKEAAHYQATIELLELIEERRMPADRCMADYFRKRRYIGAKDKRAISELLYTVLRQKLSFTWLLQQQSLNVEPRTLASLTLIFKNKDIEEFFKVDKYAPKPFSDEVIKRLSRIQPTELKNAPKHVQLNIPEWLLAKFDAQLGERLDEEMSVINSRAQTDIRVNTLKSTREELLKNIDAAGFDASPTTISEWGLRFNQRVALFNMPEFKKGWFEIQDEGSQLLAMITGVEAGNKVVDFCAGAGGKTLAMAAMMQNKGVIYACDVHSKRLAELSKRVKRAGIDTVRSHVLSSEQDKWVKHHRQKMDVVLIDAPCTGTGTWRRSPDSRWNMTADSLQQLCDTQQAILASASRLVKPGGRLVYATCSLLPDENEAQIEQFLASNDNFERGMLDNATLEQHSDKLILDEHQVRTLPALTGTDGFYAAVLQRKANTSALPDK